MIKNIFVAVAVISFAACSSEIAEPAEQVASVDQAVTTWIGPISEENGRNSATCFSQVAPNAIPQGAACGGGWCDDMYLQCHTAPAGFQLTPALAFWTPYVSEENGGPAASCGTGAVLDGLRATGSNSDNISAYCLPMVIDDSGWAPHGEICSWTQWLSEDRGNPSQSTFQGRQIDFSIGGNIAYARAVRCNGFRCDNMSFYTCSEAKYAQLLFYDYSSQDDGNTGDWSSPQDYKGECAGSGGEYLTGISATSIYVSPEIRGHMALCAGNSERTDFMNPNWYGLLHTHSLTGPDDRADFDTGDWDQRYTKAECARNEVVLGVSQTQVGRNMSKILCGPMNQVKSNDAQCTTLVYSNDSDNRLNQRSFDFQTGSSDWDPNYVKNECALNQVLKGVSRDVDTGEIHAILCCDEQLEVNP